MLNAKDSLVLIIDIQEKLTKMLGEDLCRRICDKSKKLTLAAKTMGIDVLITEQYPKGLGLTIEEIKNTPQEIIVDPMDSVMKLDPNYNKKVEEAQGLDLKTAINEVRDLVEQLKARGFQINLDELDLSGNYQMTISIKNDD